MKFLRTLYSLFFRPPILINRISNSSGFTLPEIMIGVALSGVWAVMIATSMRDVSTSYRRVKLQSTISNLQRTIFEMTQDESTCRKMLGGIGARLTAPPPGGPGAPPNFANNQNGDIAAGQSDILQIYNPTDGAVLYQPNPTNLIGQYGTSRMGDILITRMYFANLNTPQMMPRVGAPPNNLSLAGADLIIQYAKFSVIDDPVNPNRLEGEQPPFPNPATAAQYFLPRIRLTVVVRNGRLISCFPFNPGRIINDTAGALPEPLRVYGPQDANEVAESTMPRCGPGEYLLLNRYNQIRCGRIRCNNGAYPVVITDTNFANSFATVGTQNPANTIPSGDSCCTTDVAGTCN